MLSEDFVTNLIKVYPSGQGKIAFDIGAYQGQYTSLLAEKFDKVYAFEPFPENIIFLKEKFANTPNVIIIEKAISSKNDIIKFYNNGIANQGSISETFSEHEEWLYNPNNYIEVESITLDSFCSTENINPADIGIIKIDIEGAEQYFCQGANDTLTNMADCLGWIILEAHLGVDWDSVNKEFIDHQFSFVNTDVKSVDFMQACHHYLLHKGVINWVS